MQELISIIMPVYNIERYVEYAIQSVLYQTYKNFEFIIIDDGSTDRTFEICFEKAKLDNRILLFKHEKNKGICAALNKGLSFAKGEYIARFDGDDILNSDFLQKCLAFLHEHREMDLVATNYRAIDTDNKIIKNKSKVLTSWESIKKALPIKSCPVMHCWLARKKVYDLLGGYRLDTAEDYDFLLRMADKDFKFNNIPDVCYDKRIFRSGRSYLSNGLKQIKTMQYAIQLHKERKGSGRDSYSIINWQSYIKPSSLEKKLYDLSSIPHNKALMEKRKYIKIFFYIASYLISKNKRYYFHKQLLYKLLYLTWF